MSIRDQMKQARLARGLSQRRLAREIGVTHPTISSIESGRFSTSIDVLERWIDACGYKVAFIGAEHDEAVQAVQALEPQDADLVLQLARLLPRLDAADRRTLHLLVDGWYRSYGVEAEGEEGSVAAPAIVKRG